MTRIIPKSKLQDPGWIILKFVYHNNFLVRIINFKLISILFTTSEESHQNFMCLLTFIENEVVYKDLNIFFPEPFWSPREVILLPQCKIIQMRLLLLVIISTRKNFFAYKLEHWNGLQWVWTMRRLITWRIFLIIFIPGICQ